MSKPDLPSVDEDERDDVAKAFDEHVNMTAKELRDFLETDESKEVGQKDGGGESVGHEMGRRLADIKDKKKGDLTDEDFARMKKAVGYVERHRKQGGPKEDKEHSRWRYSLMNWGHDPLK